MITYQVKSVSLTHIFHHYVLFLFVCLFVLCFSKWLKQQQPKACLLLFTGQLSQRLYLKHTVKKVEGAHGFEALEKCSRFLNGALLREELYHELNKHSPSAKISRAVLGNPCTPCASSYVRMCASDFHFQSYLQI